MSTDDENHLSNSSEKLIRKRVQPAGEVDARRKVRDIKFHVEGASAGLLKQPRRSVGKKMLKERKCLKKMFKEITINEERVGKIHWE